MSQRNKLRPQCWATCIISDRSPASFRIILFLVDTLDTLAPLLLILRAVLNLLSLTNALYERVSQSDAARIMTAAVAGQKKATR